MNILVVGGEGYIGSVLVKYLLDHKINVTSIDSLIYNQKQNNKTYVSDKNYKFLNIDIRSKEISNIDFSIYDKIILLAGLVGDPITKKYPHLSNIINEDSIINLIKSIKKYKEHHIIFISTCSNYGLINEDIYASENHVLNPLSLYAKSKVKIENYLLNNPNINSTILRFATAFGLSERMRFDLTLNEFTKDLYLDTELVVYDPDTWRPYCHVMDFARLILLVSKSPIDVVNQEVYNAGSDSNNYTKRDVINAIQKQLNKNINIKFLEKGNDPRNYKVDFNKVKTKLGFNTSFTLIDGINEIINYVENKKDIANFTEIKFGNYFIDNDK